MALARFRRRFAATSSERHKTGVKSPTCQEHIFNTLRQPSPGAGRAGKGLSAFPLSFAPLSTMSRQPVMCERLAAHEIQS